MNAETSTGVSTICVYTRPSRPLGVIYPPLPASFCLLLFVLSHVNFSLASFSSLFHSSSSASPSITALHVRAVYALSSRNYFAYMPLPFSLFSAILCHPFDPHILPLPSYSTITQSSVKYTFVGGPAMWRPVIYFSSNCNFSNTYCPLDKCASLFLTR